MSSECVLGEIDALCNVEYGTRVVQKKDGGTIYPVYGGGGATFAMDSYNRENRLVIARFAMSKQCTRFVSGKFFLNDSGLTISPKDKTKIDQNFLDYYCLAMNDLFYSISRGTAQKNLDVPIFRKIKINIPRDIKLQQNIVKKLDVIFAEIDKAVAATEANIKNAEALFYSLLNSEIDGNRNGWESSSLKDVCTFINRGISPSYIEKSGVLVLNQKCIRNHKIDFSLGRRHDDIKKNIKEEKLLNYGDVLVNSTGTGTLGRVAQVIEHMKEKVSVDSHVTIVRPDSKLFFLEFFGFMMIQIEEDIKKAGEGSVGQTELSRSALAEKFKVAFPKNINLQESIYKKLLLAKENTIKLKLLMVNKLTKLQALRGSVLQQAFNGELIKQ